jgi:hypothetical protein
VLGRVFRCSLVRDGAFGTWLLRDGGFVGGVGLSITSESVGVWYRRPGVTFVPILDLTPCSVSLAWWPQDTGLVAGLAAVANEVRTGIADA